MKLQDRDHAAVLRSVGAVVRKTGEHAIGQAPKPCEVLLVINDVGPKWQAAE